MIERKILQVHQLNQLSQQILESEIGLVWVTGEISNLSIPSSGHAYFTLKDSQAQIRCALFKFTRAKIKHELKNGLQVLVLAKVSLYAPRGDYQAIIQDLEPAGLGDLQQQFLALKNKLEKEGLFLESHKKAIPALPKQIGVITSSTGAALQDILKVLRKRLPMLPVVIYPCQVQGDKAADSICQAIASANQRAECDVLIIARGGGSLEDLWPFNEEKVVRAIFASSIATISGVGHQTDFTIADFVADLRAATPSNAAELATPDQQHWLQQIERQKNYLTQLILHAIAHRFQQLSHLSKRLKHPGQLIQQQMQAVDLLERRLNLALQKNLAIKKQALLSLARALNVLSPLNTLERGFAIVKDEHGHVITKAADAQQQPQLYLQFADGEILVKPA